MDSLSTAEYGFPKGHREPEDDTPLVRWPIPKSLAIDFQFQAAAKRELLEETGLTIVEYTFDPYTTYFETRYINPKTGKTEIVVVWAAEITYDAKVTTQPEEIMSFKYVNVNEAHSSLSFEADRQSLARLVSLVEK